MEDTIMSVRENREKEANVSLETGKL